MIIDRSAVEYSNLGSYVSPRGIEVFAKLYRQHGEGFMKGDSYFRRRAYFEARARAPIPATNEAKARRLLLEMATSSTEGE